MSQHAIEVEHLVKTFGRGSRAVRAVDDLSFTVPRGAIFGLLGPNGAGKTTTLRILTTLVRATSGRAAVLGCDVVRQAGAVRRRIVVVIQEAAADLLLSVRDNLLTFARFHGLSGSEIRRRADRVLDDLGLAADAHRKVQDLSGGFRRRVQVAKVFMVDTPVVFLDEFSTGMDPILKRSVMDLLRQQASRGRTIVLTTQILSEAEELCDDILIIDKGREVARGDLNALKLLTDRVYEASVTFDRLPEGLEALVAPYAPLRVETTHNTLHVVLRQDESDVLALVSAVAARGQVLRIEIGGATLEDVFVELMQRGERP
ncbi:MAG TPA: ABC transporter ATP-binding protein [Vicinamibacterales bacterium]|nr:ABC transporter ATP-binding protein [Vicinamibacterales bacterium]